MLQVLVWAQTERVTYPVIIQGDSMLVTRQVTGVWACRSTNLQADYQRCWKLYETIREMGVDLRVEHIYREFNTVADALSNEAVDRPLESGPRPGWTGSMPETRRT